MLRVVSPFDHRYEELAVEVRVTLPPAQNVVGPEGVMVGVAGRGLTVTDVASDGRLRHPYVFPTCTV